MALGFICVFMCLCVRVFILRCLYCFILVYLCVYMCVYIMMCLCTLVNIFMCLYIYVFMYFCICIFMYVYIHTVWRRTTLFRDCGSGSDIRCANCGLITGVMRDWVCVGGKYGEEQLCQGQ